MTMEVDTDIYDNLFDERNLDEEFDKLQQQNQVLQDLIQSLESDIEKLCLKITEMKKIQDNLAKNISELFKTAKAEIDRKDKMITELRSQIDLCNCRRANQMPLKRPRTNSPSLHRTSSDSVAKKAKTGNSSENRERSRSGTTSRRSRSRSRSREKSKQSRRDGSRDRAKREYKDEKFHKRDYESDKRRNIIREKCYKTSSSVIKDFDDKKAKKKVVEDIKENKNKNTTVTCNTKNRELVEESNSQTIKNITVDQVIEVQKTAQHQIEEKGYKTSSFISKGDNDKKPEKKVDDIKVNKENTNKNITATCKSKNKELLENNAQTVKNMITNQEIALQKTAPDQIEDKGYKTSSFIIKDNNDKKVDDIKIKKENTNKNITATCKTKNKELLENKAQIVKNIITGQEIAVQKTAPDQVEDKKNVTVPEVVTKEDSKDKQVSVNESQDITTNTTKQQSLDVKFKEEKNNIEQKKNNLNTKQKFKTGKTNIEEVSKKLRNRLGQVTKCNEQDNPLNLSVLKIKSALITDCSEEDKKIVLQTTKDTTNNINQSNDSCINAPNNKENFPNNSSQSVGSGSDGKSIEISVVQGDLEAKKISNDTEKVKKKCEEKDEKKVMLVEDCKQVDVDLSAKKSCRRQSTNTHNIEKATEPSIDDKKNDEKLMNNPPPKDCKDLAENTSSEITNLKENVAQPIEKTTKVAIDKNIYVKMCNIDGQNPKNRKQSIKNEKAKPNLTNSAHVRKREKTKPNITNTPDVRKIRKNSTETIKLYDIGKLSSDDSKKTDANIDLKSKKDKEEKVSREEEETAETIILKSKKNKDTGPKKEIKARTASDDTKDNSASEKRVLRSATRNSKDKFEKLNEKTPDNQEHKEENCTSKEAGVKHGKKFYIDPCTLFNNGSDVNLTHEGDIPVLHIAENENSLNISNASLFDMNLNVESCPPAVTSSPLQAAVVDILKDDLNISELDQSIVENADKTSSDTAGSTTATPANNISSEGKVFNTSSGKRRRRVVFTMID